jgi:hypothetical protein
LKFDPTHGSPNCLRIRSRGAKRSSEGCGGRAYKALPLLEVGRNGIAR